MRPGAGAADNEPTNSAEPSSPEDQVARLRELLAAKDAEAQTNYDRFLRERADLENVKKRLRRELTEVQRFAAEPLMRDLLPVVDNLERAVEHAAGGGNGASLVEGVALVLKSLEEVLKRHGVSLVEAAPGEVFDPAKHEAIARIEVDGEPNRVVTQQERGYLLHDRLLRPAKVTVSYRKPADGAVENGGNDD